MKKYLAMTLIALMSFGLVACGEEKSMAPSEPISISSEASVDSTSATTTDSSDEKEEVKNESKKSPLEEYYERPDVAAEMSTMVDTAIETSDGLLIDVSYEVEGDTVSYTYVYNSSVTKSDVNVDGIDEYLTANVYEIIDGLKNEVGANEIYVRYVYKLSDGTVLFDKVY